MAGRFDITTDRSRKLLRIEFKGFFSPADLAGYAAAKTRALASLACRPNEHVTLCDFTACVPQAREVLELFQRSLDDPAGRSRRLAVVLGSALARLQAQRVVERSDSAFFQSVPEAEAWLFETSD